MCKRHAIFPLVLLVSACVPPGSRCPGLASSIDALEQAVRRITLSSGLAEDSALLSELNTEYIVTAKVAVDGLASGDDADRRYVCNLLEDAHPLLRSNTNVLSLRAMNSQLAERANCKVLE